MEMKKKQLGGDDCEDVKKQDHISSRPSLSIETKMHKIAENKKNTPFFIFILGLGFEISFNFSIVIGFRLINIVVTGGELPNVESRKWTAICILVSIGACLIISKPIGILCDFLGRRTMLLFCSTCMFLRLLASLSAFYFLNTHLLVIASFLNGVGISCKWLPQIILKDILPEEQVSIWFTYTFVAAVVSQAMISVGVGFLVHVNFGNIPLIYMAITPCFISFIFLIVMYFYLIESKPKSLQTNYTWKDFIFIFDIKEIMKFDNVGILFSVLFTTFWSQNTWKFDCDNFLNHHFHWTILQLSILNSIGAIVILILHPWGFTVDYFADTFVIKSAMFSKIIGYILFAVSPMISEYVAYVSAIFEAAGGIAEPILKSLLSSHGEVGERFGALHTLKSIAGFSTMLYLLFFRVQLQGNAKDSITPSLHFIIAAVMILIGTIIFFNYKPKAVLKEDMESATINVSTEHSSAKICDHF